MFLRLKTLVWGIQSTMVFSVVWGNSKIQSKKEILVPRVALILTRADQDKFTLGGNKRSLVVVDAAGAVILSGNTLTFAATDFEDTGTKGGFNLNTISRILSGFKSRGFES
jgi:hypothetical protein